MSSFSATERNTASSRSMFTSATATVPVNTFQQHLDAYTYPVFHSKDGDTSHRDFVASFYNNPYYTATRLFLPPTHEARQDPLVLKALLHKKPVYWGQDRDELVNWEAVERAWGYNKDATNSHMTRQQVSETRYAIAGPIRVMAHQETPEYDARAVHVWAPNLETTSTADYDTIINRNTGEHRGRQVHDVCAIKSAYHARFSELWHLIFKSATYGLREGQCAYIQSALLGAGCFLKGCPELLRNLLLQTQFEAVQQVLADHNTAHQNIHLKMCIYTPGDFPAELVARYRQLAGDRSDFSVGEGRQEGNVLAGLGELGELGDLAMLPVVVNAGDPLSLIGNGQSKDFTVEGFLIANAGGFNPQFRNTGFLHNPRFNPELFVPENWVRC